MNAHMLAASTASGSSPVVTVSVLLVLIAAGVVMCTYIGHRWSTLIVGILIGLYLSGTVADTAKSVVSQVLTATANGISSAVG
ncbi:hypothetical protein J7E88_17980 [Streptomyces sp. ISL-10]|uniref:hypothetical protein n=1 Tax=Streptomyces sp. ISL-10 TaxID=2819172 RepID=UPI001BE9692B|nr:hypothetical protein [Streptomyces sp. ISL-10]MBT2367145.1 hypothetical protein [Streptomyces sp. ISL-10]